MGRRYSALTGWQAPSAALDIAAIGCICLMAIVAWKNAKSAARKNSAVDSGINVTGDFARHDAGLTPDFQRSEGKLLAIK